VIGNIYKRTSFIHFIALKEVIIMGLFKKKEKATEEDLLSKIEEETMDFGALKPAPKKAPAPKLAPKPVIIPKAAPVMQKPGAPKAPAPKPAPAPVEIPEMPKPALSTQEVAKLPLFLKVQQYDKILKELNNLATSFTTMEDILAKMKEIEEEETTETTRWKNQLELTREQIRKLLSEMPETGKIRDILNAKKPKKGKGSKKLEVELKELKKTISEAKKASKKIKKAPKAPKKTEAEAKLQTEVDALHGGIKDLHDEMQHLHLELKMLNSLSQLKSQKMVKEIKKPPAPPYKKTKEQSPWG